MKIEEHIARCERMVTDNRLTEGWFRTHHQSKFTRNGSSHGVQSHIHYCRHKVSGSIFRDSGANASFAELLKSYEDYLDNFAHHIKVAQAGGHE